MPSIRSQILGYMPANVIPAIISVLTVVVFSRLLSPSEFGSYNLGFSMVLFVQGSIGDGIQVMVLRLYPTALREGREHTFLRTLWFAIAVIFGIFSLIVSVLLITAPLSRPMVSIFWVALALLILRTGVGIVQSQNRAEGRVWVFVAIECVQALVGFGAGLALIMLFRPTGLSTILGLLCGALLAACLCSAKSVQLARRGAFDPQLLQQWIRFIIPLAGASFVASVLQYADRFLVAILSGPSLLGVYAVASSLVERPTTLLCTLVSTATFPMSVAAMDNEGIEAARQQNRRNGNALLALALPACLGLALTSPYIAEVMVGPQFHEGVARLIPLLAIVALVRNIGTHYLNHAFHILRRSDLILMIYAPAAISNVCLDLALIPHFGLIGAAVASLISLCGAMIASIILGVKHFKLRWPGYDLARIGAALVPMVAVLLLFYPPQTFLGLSALILSAALSYCAAALLLGVGGFRVKLGPRALIVSTLLAKRR